MGEYFSKQNTTIFCWYVRGINVKTLNITFDDAEYNDLVKIKEKKKLNWHDFILLLVECDAQ